MGQRRAGGFDIGQQTGNHDTSSRLGWSLAPPKRLLGDASRFGGAKRNEPFAGLRVFTGELDFIDSLAQDLGYAGRQWRKRPGFAAVAVMTLSLCIGANTAVFSLVNALLVRPLPFRQPERLVWISNPNPGGGGIPGITGQANFRDWRQLSGSFETLGAYLPSFTERIRSALTGDGEPERLKSLFVTGNFLATLGVTPRLGRRFSPEECLRHGPSAVLLTESFWRRRFQSDPGIIGRSVTIDEAPHEVVGVLPEAFDFSSVFNPGSRPVDVVRPFPEDAPGYDHWGNLMAVIGRLAPGVTVAAAQAEFDHLNGRLRAAHPERGDFGARLTPLPARVTGGFRRAVGFLAGAVGSVLLIACANLSNLLLARATARRQEIAVRVALGASRGRLARQLLTESLALAFCGAALGLPLAALMVRALTHTRAFNVPLLASVRLDGAALGFTVVAAGLTGLLFGSVPAWQFSRGDTLGALKETSRGAGHSRGRARMREALVASEVALACVLLVAGGLFLRSLDRLLNVELGFRPEKTAAWRIQPSRHFATNGEETLFYQELVRRVAALPGVVAASMSDKLPLDLNDVGIVRAKGETYREGAAPSAFVRFVAPAYFGTVRIPLRAGRDFDARDALFDWHAPRGAQMVAIVNEKLARLLWPGQDALGRSLDLDDNPGPPAECRVVGVVGNVRQTALEETAGPEVYLLSCGGELLARGGGALASLTPAVRGVLRGLDPLMPADDFRSLDQIVDQAVAPKRALAALLGLFSLVALLLAAIGIYGVMAFSVSQRTQEIGLRLALGASAGGILALIIRQGMRAALVGCAAGLIGALALTRLIAALFFEVSTSDPLTFAACGLLLLAVALLACWAPARRAARVDPIVALRCD